MSFLYFWVIKSPLSANSMKFLHAWNTTHWFFRKDLHQSPILHTSNSDLIFLHAVKSCEEGNWGDQSLQNTRPITFSKLAHFQRLTLPGINRVSPPPSFQWPNFTEFPYLSPSTQWLSFVKGGDEQDVTVTVLFCDKMAAECSIDTRVFPLPPHAVPLEELVLHSSAISSVYVMVCVSLCYIYPMAI